MTPRAMIFAPLPPPVGGVASITAMLHRRLGGRADVLFVQVMGKAPSRLAATMRPLVNVARLLRGVMRVQPGGRVLMFGSSGASFWEKCAWSLLAMAAGRHVALVMVDGHFPRFYGALGARHQRVASWIMSRRRFTLVTQSPSWERFYQSLFPRATTAQVTAGVDPEFFQDPSPVRAGAPLVVLYVGWVIPEKGMVDLLDAVAAAVPDAARPFSVRIVGPAFGREDFWQSEIDRRGIGAVAQLVGAVTSRPDLLRELRGADIFVFASHFEGFPVALVEAAASARACIGARVGGVSDILDDGRAGIVVDPRNPQALAEALLLLVTDDGARSRMAQAAGARARALYTTESCVRSYARVLGITT